MSPQSGIPTHTGRPFPTTHCQDHLKTLLSLTIPSRGLLGRKKTISHDCLLSGMPQNSQTWSELRLEPHVGFCFILWLKPRRV